MTALLSHPTEPLLRVETVRFGSLSIPLSAVYRFPRGLLGFEELTQLALLPVRDGVSWLQAWEVPTLAFLVVAPDRVLPGAWTDTPGAWVVVTVGPSLRQCTANLRAPIVLDPARRQGEQRIAEQASWSTAHPVDLTVL